MTRKFSYWDDRDLEENLFRFYGISRRDMWRAVFVGENYLLGDDITESNLRDLVENNLGEI